MLGKRPGEPDYLRAQKTVQTVQLLTSGTSKSRVDVTPETTSAPEVRCMTPYMKAIVAFGEHVGYLTEAEQKEYETSLTNLLDAIEALKPAKPPTAPKIQPK
jgi:hypothetical protein